VLYFIILDIICFPDCDPCAYASTLAHWKNVNEALTPVFTDWPLQWKIFFYQSAYPKIFAQQSDFYGWIFFWGGWG
jgi:hypothetical protein